MGLDRVDTINVVDGAITGAKIDTETITRGNICSGTICKTQLNANIAIPGSMIETGTITNDLIAGTQITSEQFCNPLGNAEICNCHNIKTCCCLHACCCIEAGVMVTSYDVYASNLLCGSCVVIGSSSASTDGSLWYEGSCLVLYYSGSCYCFSSGS